MGGRFSLSLEKVVFLQPLGASHASNVHLSVRNNCAKDMSADYFPLMAATATLIFSFSFSESKGLIMLMPSEITVTVK